MSLDLGSPVLDVAFGLSFVFFLLSIVSSAISEGFAWLTKQRSKTLEAGLKGLLGKKTSLTTTNNCETKLLAKRLMEHPLVQSDLRVPAQKKKPSYLSSHNFALALIDTVKEAKAGLEGTLEYGAAGAGQLEAGLAKLHPELRRQLAPLWHEADGDLDKFRKAAEKWFDDAMDRVSGWYKRWSQVVTIVVAVIVACGLNASALRIADRLYQDESVRSAVVSGAEGAARESSAPRANGKAAEEAIGKLEALKLPIFWANDNLPWNSWQAAGESVLGWIVTAIAIALGAPFWFDALGRISRLRTTGVKPEGAPAAPPPERE